MNNTISATDSLVVFIDILLRVFNFAIIMATVFFAIFIVMAGIKLAVAQGNPKSIQSARSTFINSLIGLFVVMCFFVVIRLIFATIGINSNFPTPLAPFEALRDSINELDRIVKD